MCISLGTRRVFFLQAVVCGPVQPICTVTAGATGEHLVMGGCSYRDAILSVHTCHRLIQCSCSVR